VSIVFSTFIASDCECVLQYDIPNSLLMKVLLSICLLGITLITSINVLFYQN
jgi:meiotically up-regulated gene 157 (Mug157) protein